MYTPDVSWRDYQGIEGFGSARPEDVQELNSLLQKALTVGSAINPPGSAIPGDGFAMRVESLESTLKNTTFGMSNITLWKNLPKKPAYNTVEEFNQIQSYGVNTDAGFFAEGALPNADDSTYQRKFAIVKFLGTTRAVSHVGTIIKPAHEDLIAQETVAGTMHLLRMTERNCWFGDSTLSRTGVSGSGLQFDGFVTQILQQSPSSNVIDMRGKPLSEDALSDGAMTMSDAPNYGTPTHLYLTPKVKSDVAKTFYPKERFELGSAKDGMIGLDINGFLSPAGAVKFEQNVFLNDLGPCNTAVIGDPTKVPTAPTISTPAAAGVDSASQFTANDAGTYFYYVVAANQYGKSAPLLVNGSALSVASGQSVTFGVTPGSIIPDWWEVYRTPTNGAQGTQRLIQRAGHLTGVGATTVTDQNLTLPNTGYAVLFQMDQEAVSFKQLAPLVRVPLAIVDTSIRWMQLLYGTPVLYTPGKIVLYKNIGRLPGYVGAA